MDPERVMDTWRNVSHVSKLKKKELRKKGKQDQGRKKKKESQGERATFWEEKRSGRRERENGKKKVFRFSIRSTKTEPSVFIRARRKVDPRIASYVCVSKSWSFVKLHEVGNFPSWNIFSLKAR